MKPSKLAFFAIGALLVLGAYAFVIHNSGFCIDSSILTMELPAKEGLNAKPTFSLETELPTVPDSIGIYSMVVPDVTMETARSLVELRGIDRMRIIDSAVMRKADLVVTPIQISPMTEVLKTQAAPVEMEAYSMEAMKRDSLQLADRTNLVDASALRINELVDMGSVFSYATENSYLSINKKSAAETLIMDYPTLIAPRVEPLPSEDILKEKADAYLAENKILPDGYTFSGISYLQRQLLSETGAVGNVERLMGIAKYNRMIDGIPVEGAGSTICVLMGEGGKVQGYTKVSRDLGQKIAISSVSAPGISQAIDTISRNVLDLKPVENIDPGSLKVANPDILKVMATETGSDNTYQLLTPDEAYQLLQERGLTTEIANVDTATITDVHLAYFESEPDKLQNEIEPIYVFSGVASGPDGSVEYKEYMYALKIKNGQAPFQMSAQATAQLRKIEQIPTSTGARDEGEVAS